jgi:hypothetical protein
MENEIGKKLDGVIETEIKNLSGLKSGSDEKSKAIDDLATLYKLRIEETKTLLGYEEKQDRLQMEKSQFDDGAIDREYEAKLKRDQLDEQIKDRYFKVGIATAELIIPLVFYTIWMNKGFKFEEKGTFTSTTFKELFRRFRPTKK